MHINDILSDKYFYLLNCKKDEKEYNDTLIEYYNFIKESAKLVKELSLPYNSISISSVLTRLIEMGAFSINNKFIHKNIDETLFLEPGIQVVNGMGVCRNTAGFQRNIFKELNIPIEEFTCIMDDNYIECDLNGDANHVANVITYNGVLYVSDVFNDLLGSFIDENVAKVFSNFNNYFYYKPEFLLNFTYLEIPDILIRLEKYAESSFKNQITIKEYNEIRENTLMKMMAKIKLVKEFRNDTEELKEKIIRKIK